MINAKIQVLRPREDPTPSFEFGHLKIEGDKFADQRAIAIQQSDVIILLGGGGGTLKVIRQARTMGKPIVPVGFGGRNYAAVDWWYKMYDGITDGLAFISIDHAGLERIGPKQRDLHQVAIAAVELAENLASGERK